MSIFEKIKNISDVTYNSYLKKAKEEGKGIIGYFCSYVPEEIIHAAGFIPYRMRVIETEGTSRGDTYFSPLNCTFVRHCLSKAINGDFKFLDGVIFMNGCDHTRRMYDNWRVSVNEPEFKYMFVTPHITGSNALQEYSENINYLIKALEENFSVTITNEALRESIGLYNKKRELLKEIDEMRKERNVPIKGSEMLSVVLAVSALPVETANTLLEELCEELRNRVVSSENDLRVFIASGCLEEIEHLKLFEDEGGIIVADNICFGKRYYNRSIRDTEDPIIEISGSYLKGLSCPRMMDEFYNRLDYVNNIIKEYRIDAIVYEKLKFCDLWGWEIFRMRKEAKKQNFPILPIERELYGGGTGQIKTRIQAFYEQVRNNQIVDNAVEKAASSNYRSAIQK